MTVYILNNMTIHDRDEYRAYVRAFMPVFMKYGGTMLAVQDSPPAVEGTWPFDRTVLGSLPTREAVDRWYNSDEYQAIARRRRAATSSNVTVLEGLPPGERTGTQPDLAAIDSLVARFFGVFDNRRGRTPVAADFAKLFAPSALIATHAAGMPQFANPSAFVEPRIALLNSGALVDFHEWETKSETEILGTLGVRRSRYSKQGHMDGKPFQGAGTKVFHFARLNHEWRIAFVSWIDDQSADADGAA